MKKQILKSALIAMAGVGLLAGGAMADLVNDRDPAVVIGTAPASELALQTIFNNIGADLNAATDQNVAAIWNATDGGPQSYFITEFAGDTSVIGIYSYTTNIKQSFSLKTDGTASFDIVANYNGASDDVFNDLKYEDSTGINYIEDFGSAFGFYINNTTDGTFMYTEDKRNDDMQAMALAYLLDNNDVITWKMPDNTTKQFSASGDDWIFAFEDTYAGSDRDFNDIVFAVEDITAAVPEPATMLLFGTGLAGLAAIGRRRKTQA